MLIKTGIVKRSTGSWYEIILESKEVISCRLKGKIRLRGLKSTNPIAVGDRVEVDMASNSILGALERKNYILRRSNNLSKYSHIIAANIDIAFLVFSLKSPRTTQGFIDRFLLTCEAYNIEAQLILNKIDLLDEQELELADIFLEMYKKAGYSFLKVSANEQENWDVLQVLVKGKTTLFSGHSGVGKSSLIKRLIPDAEISIGKVSEAHYKGKHTTTFAEMHLLNQGGYIIDTPGIKDFGLVNMNKEEVSHYFPEMAPNLRYCKFSNCLHLNEPGCKILELVEEGEIDINRYNSYVAILLGDDEVNTPDYVWRKTLNEK